MRAKTRWDEFSTEELMDLETSELAPRYDSAIYAELSHEIDLREAEGK